MAAVRSEAGGIQVGSAPSHASTCSHACSGVRGLALIRRLVAIRKNAPMDDQVRRTSQCRCHTNVVHCIGMGTKLMAVRVETELWDAAVRRAEVLGTSVSEVVREALREAVSARPLGDRVGLLRGSIQADSADAAQDGWQSEIRAHNWRS